MSKLVMGAGPIDAKICMVGEAPGAEEERLGRPFIGSSGELLTTIMHQVGISREEVYITNVVKERPPGNNIEYFIKFDKGRILATAKYTEYETMLHEELAQTKANVYIAIGGVALHALCRMDKISKRRGSILQGFIAGRPVKVVPIIHPASALRNYPFTHFIRFDLRRAKEESTFPEIRLPSRMLRVNPTFIDAMGFLQSCLEIETIGFDIEVVNEEVSCISLARSPYDVISIPFYAEGRDIFTIDQEAAIWKAIADILQSQSIKKVGHNIDFDATFLFMKYGIRIVNIADTMVYSKVCYPDFPKGLDFVTSICTKEPYYKDDGKKWFRLGGSIHNFWIYNAKDSAVCIESLDVLRNEAATQGNEETVARQTAIVPSLIYMQARGIKADKKGMETEIKNYDFKIEEAQAELNKLCGYPINPNSTKQLQEYFYIRKGVKPYISRSTGNISVDAMALKRLSKRGFREAQIILEMRHLLKIKGTYFEMEMDDDNRIRCSFDPVGTENGRLSSSKTIFGKGGNMQNLPPEFLKFLIADEGCFLYNIDLSQAENRIVAYVAPEPNMIAAFEKGEDIHRQTAGLILNKKPEEISDEEGSSSIGGGLFSERFWGKKCKLRSCQVLSRSGWISIESAYRTGCEIAQWETGAITFIRPIDWYSSIYTGDIHTIKNQRIFQEATEEHKMPILYSNRDKEYFITKSIKNYPKSGHHFAPLSGTYFSGKIELPPAIIQLIVAFQADGNWSGNGMHFRLYKQRKIDRLVDILSRSGVQYSIRGSGFHVSAVDNIVLFIKDLIGKDKEFGPWLLRLDRKSLAVFIDEVPKWDGSADSYFTTSKINAEWVQTIAHLCGKAANIAEQNNSNTSAFGNKILYRVNIRNSTRPATSAIVHTKRHMENEPIFCPTVPSGFFLCKEGGIISITGNSNHSLNYDLGYRSFALLCEIQDSEAKYIVERYHAVYPGVRQYHAWIKAQLSKNRTITNCFGRRRLFTNRWGDELFKEAYAFIPQSTVADIINSRGLSYVMNNPAFKGVEILNQVHDALVVQISYLDIPVWQHAECIKLLVDSLQQPLSYRGMTFSIPADVHIGISLNKKKMEGVKVNEFSTAQGLARELSTIHNKIRTTYSI